MGKRDKLIEKLRRKPPEADFGDVERLLESFGFQRASSDGSHFVYRDGAGRQVTVPTLQGRRVKRAYVVRVLEILGLNEEECND